MAGAVRPISEKRYMQTFHDTPAASLFKAHPNLGDVINRRIIQSEIEGGVYLHDLARGAVLEIETEDWVCTMVFCGGNEALVSGHPRFCLDPVRVRIAGSTWRGSMLKARFIGRGMHLEFMNPQYQRIITSRIVEIRARNTERSGSFDPRNAFRRDDICVST
jgi:hypothetical protein